MSRPIELLRVALSDLRYQLAGLPAIDQRELALELGSIAQRAARMSAYAATLGKGCDHAAAVDEQNRVAAAVRVALGYTPAEIGLEF